ncbi:MAG: ABC transporter ATP-binding protein [Clostridia bacterium]|nr:ABC transporter ATP-binding protein [Clostridia bacterium]
MKKMSKLGRFVSYYRPHLGIFTLDMVCALIISAIDVAYPWLSQYALDELLPKGEYSVFMWLIIGVSMAFALRSVLMYIVTYIGHQLGVRMEADMRRDVFTHIQKLSFSFFDRSRTGALLSRCTNDLFDITELAHHGPEDLFISLVTLIGSLIVMFTIEWRLALLLMACIPVMIVFVMLLRKRMSTASRRVKEGIAVINSDIESSISGARVAQAFNNEEYESEKFDRGNSRFINSKREYYKAMGVFMGGMEFFMNILKVVVLAVGGALIMSGGLSMVALLTFTLYVSSFVSPIRKLAMFAETYTVGMAGFGRFVETMETQPEITDAPGAEPLGEVRGHIRFENVSFSYDGEHKVLSGVDLDIPAGKTLALVGPSGGGKTTICHLIPRFYEPIDGIISIDGRNIADVTLSSLRRNIGIVQQDVFLFADTIRENIRYGRMDATDDEIIAAAKLAEIHEDIMRMPNGYDTMVGERGVTLSGGQKQRMSIARIFIKNPPILILDEATSALDSATEAKITDAFERLSAGRTTLVIAHRLSTVRHADEIVVIDDEDISERGTHDELMRAGGKYAALQRAQSD